MAKVSVDLGFTFKFGEGDSWAKIYSYVHDIDTELPLKEQLEKVDKALETTFKYLMLKVDKQIEAVVKKAEEL